MTTIWDVYNFIRQLTDKAGKGFVPPDEASKWLEAGQMSLFNQFRSLGTLDNLTQTALAPFVVSAAFSASATGHFVKPANYVQGLRIVNAEGLEHTPILFNELRDALISQLEPISEYPRYNESGTYIVVYPQDITEGIITYYRTPTAPVIGYTSDADGFPVYSSGTSTQLEMPQAFWLDIIIKALPFIGVNLGDSDVYALAAQQPAMA